MHTLSERMKMGDGEYLVNQVCVCMYVCLCVCMYVFLFLCVSVSVCVNFKDTREWRCVVSSSCQSGMCVFCLCLSVCV